MILSPAAIASHLCPALLVMAHPRISNDSCGYGNDAETQEHQHRNQELPPLLLQQHVAVTDCGNCQNSPILRLPPVETKSQAWCFNHKML